MITVTIAINNRVILTRSAVNTTKVKKYQTIYRVDTGEEILHFPEDGAVVLAKKMLDTIKTKAEW